jgi:hypothetical protein
VPQAVNVPNVGESAWGARMGALKLGADRELQAPARLVRVGFRLIG